MELFQEYKEQAKKNIAIADHMVSVTYKFVADPKVLLSVLNNIFLSVSYAMSSLLHYELTFKRVPSFQENFEEKLNLFKEKCVTRYNLNIEYITLILDMKYLALSHNKSSIEFSRKDKLVICEEGYNTKTITINEIQRYISKAKLFIQEISNIMKREEGIFK